MSKSHEWGDMIITYLSKKDDRRHKTWCIHYDRETKNCKKPDLYCCGSAHCVEYEVDPIKRERSVRASLVVVAPPPVTVLPSPPPAEEEDPFAAVGQARKDEQEEKIKTILNTRLSGQVVFIKSKLEAPLEIGEVIEDELKPMYGSELSPKICVRFDDGKTKTYDKLILAKKQRIYIYNEDFWKNA